MNNEEFVTKIKRYSVDDSVNSVLRSLAAPRLLPVESEPVGIFAESFAKHAEKANRIAKDRAEWFRSLSDEGRTILSELLEECSEATMLQAFCFIDGVGGDSEGVFEIVESIEGKRKKVLNPQNTDMLHDLFSEVCERDRLAARGEE